MIKSKMQITKGVELKYPLLMTAEHGEGVILFHEALCGVVIAEPLYGYGVGYYSEHWDMDNFTPLVGSITLENE